MPNNPNTITVNQDMLGNMTQEDYARIAAIVSHEGTHWLGTGLKLLPINRDWVHIRN